MSQSHTPKYTNKTMTEICVCCFREEWQWLQALSSLEESVEMDHEVQSAPHRLLQDLRTAIKDLMAHINVPANQVRVSPKTDSVALIGNRRLSRFTTIPLPHANSELV